MGAPLASRARSSSCNRPYRPPKPNSAFSYVFQIRGRPGGVADPLTLMAVHAHPNDESSSAGGVLARYVAAGLRTVVVTCTNGELGDGPGGVKPGEGRATDHHDG